MSNHKAMTRHPSSNSAGGMMNNNGAGMSMEVTPDKTSHIPQALKGLADGIVEQAKHTAESKMVSDKKDKVADGLGDVAHALRQATSARHEAVIDAVRPYVDSAAEQVERASTYIHDRSITEMGTDLRTFARKEPALFLGGAFLVGVVGGRFLKAGGTPSLHLGEIIAGEPKPESGEKPIGGYDKGEGDKNGQGRP